MTFSFLVTIEQPDAWAETATFGNGLKGRDWCEKTLGDLLAEYAAAKLLIHAPGFKSAVSVDAVDFETDSTGDWGSIRLKLGKVQ